MNHHDHSVVELSGVSRSCRVQKKNRYKKYLKMLTGQLKRKW